MASPLRIKRGTRSQLNTAAAASGLASGEPYLITDEGRVAVGTGATTYAVAEKQADTAIPLIIDGGGVAITTGTKFAFCIPFACTIIGFDLFGDQTGSIVIDLKKATYANYPTTTSITASAKPTLSSARKTTNSTLTGWTTSVAAGDVIEVVVDSAATLLVASLVLKVRKV